MANVICAVSIVIFTLFPMHVFNILHRNRRKLRTKKFQDRYEVLIMDLDTRRPMAYHFYSIFFLRRIVFVIALVTLSSKPRVQWVFLLTQSVAVSTSQFLTAI